MTKGNALKKFLLSPLGAMAFVLIAHGVALAFTTPSASTALAYDVYDIAVNDILQGPIGFVAGLGLVGYGIYGGVMGGGSPGMPIMSILGGGAIAASETIIESLGYMM